MDPGSRTVPEYQRGARTKDPCALRNEHAHAATAEVGAGRERATGNAGQPNSVRPPSRAALSQALDRVRQAAKESGQRVPALWQHVAASDRLREASDRLKHDAAPGLEGQPWATYGERLDTTLRDVADRRQRGASHAPPVERVSSPKAEGRQRPIGEPRLADTSVQRATVAVRNAIDEPEFLGFAYGARPGRSPHHALEAVTVGRAKRTSTWGLDADMRGLYEALHHAGVGQCIAPRIGDQRVVRPSRKGRKAGGLEDGHWRQPAAGRPQGGRARPLLAHLSLPDVFDLWAAQWRRRHARGDVLIVRYGDDCMVGFEHKDAAEQLRSDLRERCPRCYRALPPAKTRRMECGRWASARRQRRGQGQPETVAFLGLTPMGSPTTRGKVTGRRCPSATRLRKQRQEVTQTRRERMPWPIATLGAWLTRVVVGHYRSSGVPRNRGRLRVCRDCRLRDWCRIVRRRSQRQRLTWQRRYPLATPWLPAPHLRHPYPAQRWRVTTQGKSPVRSCRTPGSVRGVSGNRHPYRDRQPSRLACTLSLESNHFLFFVLTLYISFG